VRQGNFELAFSVISASRRIEAAEALETELISPNNTEAIEQVLNRLSSERERLNL
jgi:hypothetical protein